jgi:hypothetical protein
MYINHAEFVLLSRTGRGPFCTRAGPQPFGLAAPPLEPRRPRRLFRKRGRSALPVRRGGGKEYFELEFAVGFPVEDETLL